VASETDLQFDGWTVNRISGEISREGRTARLPQQPLRILVELFDHAGDVVTREQLVKVLWPAGIVDFDNGLNVAVRKLRVALDDVGEVPRYVETLPRVGYRFIGSREAAGVTAAPPHPQTGARASLVLILAALAIALAVGWWLGAGGSARDTGRDTPHHVPSVRAQELYLEGIHDRSRRDTNTNTLAIEKFEAALREDPNYPEAWAALSDSFTAAAIRQMMKPDAAFPRALAAARRALELDDSLAVSHASMGLYHLDHDKDFAAAEREFRRALELDPHSARAWHHFAMARAEQGHVEEALTALRRARELEPMTLLFSANYAMVLINARRYDEAIELLEPIVAANPKFDQARGILGRAYTATGKYDGALEMLEGREDIGVMQADLGVVYAKMGRREEAQLELARLQARASEGFPTAYDQSVIQTALGELDQGCELLARGLEDRSFLINWMRLDPRIDALRGRQCYADVEKRLFGDR